MKKFFAIFMAALMLVTFVACSSDETEEKVDDTTVEATDEPAADETADDEAAEDEPAVDVPETDSAVLDILNTAFAAYSAEEQSYFMAPAEIDISDTDMLTNTLACKTGASYIDAAAYYAHFMNLHNLTVTAYHVADAVNVSAFVDAMKADVESNQWICGFPEKFIIASVDTDCVVVAFGSTDNVDFFVSNLADAEILVDQPLA